MKQVAASSAAAPKAILKAQQISYEGTKGKKTNVEVNYFTMNADKLVNEAYHYDLEFTPPGPRKFIQKALEIFRITFFKDSIFAFDGKKNVYTKDKLKIEVLEETIQLKVDQREIPYKIKIQFTHSVDLSILKQ